jgi:hypothetical protein
VPFSRIPREAFDEAGLKNPKKKGFREHGEISGHLERGFVFFLDEDSDQVVTLMREGHLLRVHGSNEVVGGDPAKFNGLD